jgi:predicted flap endonuclease-1-like 5' DNA nuclease
VIPSRQARKLASEAVQARADAKAANLAPINAELQQAGKTSLKSIAATLNEQGVPTSSGIGQWSASEVSHALARVG